VGAKIRVHALDADRSSSVRDDKAHLSDAAHHAHWLVRFREHVVGAGDLQLGVEENRERDTHPAFQLPGALGGVAIDNENISPEPQRFG
jgi:hypothetical protein